MRSPFVIAAPLCLALALGGCSFAASSKKTNTITGPAKPIGTLVNNFSSDANNGDDSTICDSIFSTALEKQLNALGGCEKIVANQLDAVDTFSLTITKYNVTGDNAVAVVKSIYNGKNRLETLKLVNQPKGGWRINSIS